MKYKGIINNFSQIVVSDPHYEKDVWCRYEKNFSNPSNWDVEIIIKNVDEMQNYKGMDFRVIGLDFSILMKKQDCFCELLDIGKFVHPRGVTINKTKIGIDTAQVCMGTNEKAKEINEYAKKINQENALDDLFTEYNPYFAIQTMSDGILGTVQEGTKNDETNFILITGFFDECADVHTIDELKEYLVNQLNIKDLEIQKDINEIEKDIDYDI